jgi:hypothetical protein
MALDGTGTDAELAGNLIGGDICGEQNEHLYFPVSQVLVAAAAVVMPRWEIWGSGCGHDGFQYSHDSTWSNGSIGLNPRKAN